MNPNLRFDIEAEAFYRYTGMLAPGKDAPLTMATPSREDREKEWRTWRAAFGDVVDVVIDAMARLEDQSDA